MQYWCLLHVFPASTPYCCLLMQYWCLLHVFPASTPYCCLLMQYWCLLHVFPASNHFLQPGMGLALSWAGLARTWLLYRAAIPSQANLETLYLIILCTVPHDTFITSDALR